MRHFIDLFSALVVGAMAVVLAISFASIVYSGPLGAYLDRGIGSTLVAASIASGLGAVLFSFRGTISNAQDLTAILLSAGAASIAADIGSTGGADPYPTVFMLLAVASVAAGLTMILLGLFRLSYLIRFIPYPVMGGFLAATGYLLIMGGLGILVDEPMTLMRLPMLFTADMLPVWTPWMAVAAMFMVALRVFPYTYTLPVCVALSCAGFFAILALGGRSSADAAAAGLLLGPFGSGSFVRDLNLDLVPQVQWRLIAEQAATILAVVAMTIIGTALNLSGIELATKRSVDTNRDFVVVGLGNVIASPAGGLIDFPGFATTLLGFRLGLRGVTAGAVVAAFCLATAFFGATVIEALPRGLFAAIIAYLGLDLLRAWIWVERKRLRARDFAIVLLILGVSAVFGFLPALAVGLAVAIILFVVSYARLEFLRLASDLSLRRSTIERDLSDMDHLSQVGHKVRVFEFSGYLFFGTAARLKRRIEAELSDDAPLPEAIILDFSHVQGIDASASHNIEQIAVGCAARGIDLIVTGLNDATGMMKRRLAEADPHHTRVFPALDDALQSVEDQFLAARTAGGGPDTHGTFLALLQAAHPDIALETLFPVVDLSAGQTLFRAGDAGDEMYVLLSGKAQVQIATSGAAEKIVAQLRPGALIGEVAYYGDTARSADLCATEDARLLVVERHALDAIGKTHPALGASFARIAASFLARRMARTTNLLGVVLQ
jgi:SulP family sulfate permease